MPITALIVRVAEAERLVGSLRAQFDPTASLGVPAHVTVLVPFMAPQAVSADVLAKLREALGSIAAFEFRLAGIGRWPKTTYLKPEPAGPFIELTQAVTAAFPAYLPYEGQHAEVVPHLTVADGDEGAASSVESALRASLAASPPVVSVCGQVELIENSSRSWKFMQVFPLAASDARVTHFASARDT